MARVGIGRRVAGEAAGERVAAHVGRRGATGAGAPPSASSGEGTGDPGGHELTVDARDDGLDCSESVGDVPRNGRRKN